MFFGGGCNFFLFGLTGEENCRNHSGLPRTNPKIRDFFIQWQVV